jgi:hypothetical protein
MKVIEGAREIYAFEGIHYAEHPQKFMLNTF